MTQTSTPGETILAAARRLQEEKLAAVEAVAGTRGEIETIRREMAARIEDAERRDAVAYQSALKAGWTEDELRKVGIRPPARQAPGRPRRKGKQVPSAADVEVSGANALVASTLQREAEASVRLDRDETHVVGVPAAAEMVSA